MNLSDEAWDQVLLLLEDELAESEEIDPDCYATNLLRKTVGTIKAALEREKAIIFCSAMAWWWGALDVFHPADALERNDLAQAARDAVQDNDVFDFDQQQQWAEAECMLREGWEP